MHPRLTQIEAQKIREPLCIANIDRLVETVKLTQVFSILGRDFDSVPFVQCHHDLPLDRTARHEVNNEEDDECYSDESGDDQKEATDEVSDHFFTRCALSGLHSQLLISAS